MRLATLLSRKNAHKARNPKSFARIRPILFSLEDRTTPSTIRWVNKGTSTTDSDGFNSVFGTNAARARAVVDQALLDWQLVITSFNYANSKLNDTYDMTVVMANSGTGLGANALPTLQLQGKPTAGT